MARKGQQINRGCYLVFNGPSEELQGLVSLELLGCLDHLSAHILIGLISSADGGRIC